jgi:starvation-inducible DNA-binding protein
MDELIEQMKVALASTFAFYLKAHNFHWNVEGVNFPQYHSFFETIYSDAWGAVDGIAEHLRTLQAYAPGSFARYSELSIVKDEVNVPMAASMMSKILEDNNKLIEHLTKTQASAEKAKKMGLANYLQDRIDIHEKHGWMIRSILKG